MWEIYKNDEIEAYEDEGGVTNTHYVGSTRLGKDFFTGEELAPTYSPTGNSGQAYDDTWDGYSDAWDGYDGVWGAETTTDILSRRLVCDRCGDQIKSKSELIKQSGWLVCSGCIDG